VSRNIIRYVGIIFLPCIWLFLSYIVQVPERYLPSPVSVINAVGMLGATIAVHAGLTALRLLQGFLCGSLIGVWIGIMLYKHARLHDFFLPSFQAMRAVPPIATIPFFLLWFGFSETGKVLIVIFGISINLAIVSYQVLKEKPEQYLFSLRAMAIENGKLPWKIAVPLVAERLLPTLRFSLAVSLGLVITSELLGSQLGLGYLIQSSRSTFAIAVILLCVTLLGVMNALADKVLVIIWQKLIFWRAPE
jgi:ABC-type nitrate/sulfonate/bicarbonate transport system permease component